MTTVPEWQGRRNVSYMTYKASVYQHRWLSLRNILRVMGAFDDVGMDGVGFGFLQVSGKAGHAFGQARAAQHDRIPQRVGGRVQVT